MQRWDEMTPDQKCEQLRQELHEVRLVLNGAVKKLDELAATVGIDEQPRSHRRKRDRPAQA